MNNTRKLLKRIIKFVELKSVTTVNDIYTACSIGKVDDNHVTHCIGNE